MIISIIIGIFSSFLYVGANNLAFIAYYTIVLFLYSQLGIALTTTLGMASLVFALIIGYFLNRDRPDRKSLLIAGLVLLAIAANVYFKR